MPVIRQDIELLRLLASFGVVWFHSKAQGGSIAYSGLIIFILISFCLNKTEDISFLDYFAKKAKRLLMPWAIWILPYGVVNLLANHPFFPRGNGFWSSILAGSSLHLWYLPYICFMMVVVWPIYRIKNRNAVAKVFAGISALLLIFAPIWRPWSIGMGIPWEQYFHAFPGVCIGIFISLSRDLSKENKWFILFTWLIGLAINYEDLYLFTPYVIAISIFYLVEMVDFKKVGASILLEYSKYSMGIYLIHPLFLMLLAKTGFSFGVSLPVVCFGVCVAVVRMCSGKFPKTSRYIF